jgi:UDP-glucose-4-epimerase GalE
MRVMVTGGAGYIGSFVLRAVVEAGHEAFVVDDLSKGHRKAAAPHAVNETPCGNTERMAAFIADRGVDAVIHLAALSLVGESVRNPGLYWARNVGQAAGLLMACEEMGVKRFVLSSTAAVYGEPERTPITEEMPTQPTNPYGATKRAIEEMLGHFGTSCGMGWVSLRYFNAAGAMPDGSLGEDHDPETHLVPLAIRAAQGVGKPLTVFGTDYPTPDGTCLRDYVHVLDLARAHVRALDWLEAHPGESLVCNLGGGTPASVKEILAAIEEVSGREVPHTIGERRAGDPSVLVASIARARSELGWEPQTSDVPTIVKDAWAWHAAHPEGFAKG